MLTVKKISRREAIKPHKYPQKELAIALSDAPVPKTNLQSFTKNIPSPSVLRQGIEYQQLSAQVYADDQSAPIDWTILGDLNHPMGWRARAYQDTNGNICVAFRGSATAKEFMVLDVGIALAMVPSLNAVDPWLKRLGISEEKIKNAVFTGHSLGGTLASAQSLKGGRKAYVFDSPGLPGYSEQELANVTAFQSAANIVNGLPYKKAGPGQTYDIPLPPNVVQDIALREAYARELQAFYFVQNDVTRAINAAYLLISNVQNLADVHSVMTIGQSMENMYAGMQHQISLQDSKYDVNSGSGPYAIQMMYEVQQAIDYTNKLLGTSTPVSDDNDQVRQEFQYEAERKATLQALEDAQKSLSVYKKEYKKLTKSELTEIEKMEAEIGRLRVNTEDSSTSTEFYAKKNQIVSSTSNIKTGMNASTSTVDKAVAFLEKPENRQYTLDLGFEILAGFGVEVNEADKKLWNSTVAMLVTLSGDFNTYRITSKEYDRDSQFMCLAGPTPGQAFLSITLENLQGYFNGMASIANAFGRPELAQIATIGGSATTIALQLGRMTGLVAGAFTPVGAVAAISTAAVSLFSALSGKGKAQQEQAEAMQKALMQISQQIAALHQEMRASFEQVFKNQQAILEYVQNALATISQTFYIPTLDMLSSIQETLWELEEQINNQAISQGMREFSKVTNTTVSIQEEHYAAASTKDEEQIILHNTDDLIYWLREGATSSDFTGANFPLSTNENTALINLTRRVSSPRYEFAVAHLIQYLKTFYPASALGKYAQTDIFNVTMWSSAVSYYALILKYKPELLAGYATKIIESFKEKGLLFLRLITDLRSNTPFLNDVLNDFERDILLMVDIFRIAYVENAPVEFKPSSNSILAMNAMTKQDPNISKAIETGVARNQLLDNIGMLAGSYPAFKLASAYATQQQQRVYQEHFHQTELLGDIPRQIKTALCWIKGEPHLAVFYFHVYAPVPMYSGDAMFYVELLELKSKKCIKTEAITYPAAQGNYMHLFGIDDIVVNTTETNGVKESTHVYLVGRIFASQTDILRIETYDLTQHKWRNGETWLIRSTLMPTMQRPSACITSANEKMAIFIDVNDKPSIARMVAGKIQIQQLLAASYFNLTMAQTGNTVWFIVGPATNGPWELYEVPDITKVPNAEIKRHNLNPSTAPTSPSFVFAKSTVVQMQIIDAQIYILFTCTENGTALYRYNVDEGWTHLVSIKDMISTVNGWNLGYYKYTINMKQMHWKSGDVIHHGLLICARSSTGENVWLFSITDNRFIECKKTQGNDITRTAIVMMGPEWTDANGYCYNEVSALTDVTVLSDLTDQDQIIFTSRNPLVAKQLDIKTYTVFPDSRPTFATLTDTMEEWLKNMQATEPQVFTLEDNSRNCDFLIMEAMPIDLASLPGNHPFAYALTSTQFFYVDTSTEISTLIEITPEQRQELEKFFQIKVPLPEQPRCHEQNLSNDKLERISYITGHTHSKTELWQEYVATDADYSYLSLGADREIVTNTLKTRTNDPRKDLFESLMTDEISTIVLAGYVNQSTNPNDKNIWSWLGDNIEIAKLHIKGWQDAGKALDEYLAEVLKLKIPEGSDKNLFEKLEADSNISTEAILKEELAIAELWEKNSQPPYPEGSKLTAAWVQQWKKWLNNPLLSPNQLKHKIEGWQQLLASPNNEFEHSETALIDVCVERRLEWIIKELKDRPEQLDELRKHQAATIKAEQDWVGFCANPDIHALYVNNMKDIKYGLPIGWRCAYVYLCLKPSEKPEDVYMVEIDKQRGTAVPGMLDEIRFVEGKKVWLLAMDQGYGFSLMHKAGSINLVFAAPQLASPLELGIRSAEACLYDLTAHQKVLKAKKSLKPFPAHIKDGSSAESVGLNSIESSKKSLKNKELYSSPGKGKSDSNLSKISAPSPMSIPVREALFVQAKKDKDILESLLNAEIQASHFIGQAKGKGDCFFDAVAQALNAREDHEVYDVKSLRLLCDEYVKDPSRNGWVENAVKADGDDYLHYLARIAFTVEEMAAHEKNKTLTGTATWGRPAIEGRIICETYNIKIHVMELRAETQDAQGLAVHPAMVTHQVISKEGSHSVDAQAIDYAAEGLLHLAVGNLHFVPILPQESKLAQQKDQKLEKIEELGFEVVTHEEVGMAPPTAALSKLVPDGFS